MTKAPQNFKRKNKAVLLGDMIGNALDPALKRRGFATQDLVANWAAIAPAPYNKVTLPDKLVWPRKDKPDSDGAVLYVRCMEGSQMALSYDAANLAAAINRYYGYYLISAVKISLNIFQPVTKSTSKTIAPLKPEKAQLLETMIADVQDEALKTALEKLGKAVLSTKK